MNWSRERQEAMERYAQADRTDPFALDRCKAHMRNGIAGFRQEPGSMPWVSEKNPRRMSIINGGNLGEEAFYSATPHTEMRSLPDGREYLVIEYRNRVRP